ncbi:ATP-binding protein [Phytohalomonas tamaricis]|uniref:ATP-binding protein n=1 Tax=Phytohalomonas tamaricis TaxID=2081032 RepID=UPI000D0AC5A8|nr:ATP-binding protein [Phytohalomonas tamaricis]
MFSRISIKLFFAIFLVNTLISGLIYLSISRSLDEGFLDYLRHSQQQRITTLTQSIAESYARHGNWEWLRHDPDAWRQLLRFALVPRGGNFEPPEGVIPPPLPPELADPRQFVLIDAHGDRIIDSRLEPAKLRYAPITLDGIQIGSLGYRAPEGVITKLDRLFLQRQLRSLTIILGSMLFASLILAGGLALWLGRRTRAMALATQALAGGDYSVRLSPSGRDELSQLSADINALAFNLEQNRRARQQWVADIAHELRTPLAVLRGEIEAMQDGVRPMNAGNLASLSQEVEQLNRLVEDLRLLAQSDAHTLEAPFETVDLSAHLTHQLSESRHWIEGKGIALDSKIASGITIQGAPHRLRQLWHNLLGNSMAYTDAPGKLHVSLARVGRRAEIVWEDSSPGVPDDALPRLTERLFRLDASRNRRRGGSGLGLSIAQALVHLHGGQMEASVSPLGGLRWTLSFPLD